MPNMAAFCFALVFTVLSALAALTVRSRNHQKGGAVSPSGGGGLREALSVSPRRLASKSLTAAPRGGRLPEKSQELN